MIVDDHPYRARPDPVTESVFYTSSFLLGKARTPYDGQGQAHPGIGAIGVLTSGTGRRTEVPTKVAGGDDYPVTQMEVRIGVSHAHKGN